MADQPGERHVHFNEDPISNVWIFQKRPPHIILRVTPPSPSPPPVSPAPRAPRAARPLPRPPSPAKLRDRVSSTRSRRPSPFATRGRVSTDEALAGIDNESSSSDESFDFDLEVWSPERASAEIAASRTSQTQSHFLFACGDVPTSLDTTRRVLDELLTDFITELCFEASRSAQLAGRQKIKIDDIRFACRKSPTYLGKIQEIQEKKEEIDRARKTLDVTDDKITRSNVKAMEEPPLGDADDDMDVDAHTSRGKRASSK